MGKVMVKSISCNPGTMEADVFLMGDTKEDILNATPNTIVGFPVGYKMEFGSKALTTSGEVGILKSDRTWNFGD